MLGIRKISESGISSTTADVRIIMQAGLLCNASSMILAHNHPSGNLKPSADDLKIAQNIKEAAKILYMQLLDHCILTSTDYLSFADDVYYKIGM